MLMPTENPELPGFGRFQFEDDPMPNETNQNSEWLSSGDVRKLLRISSCELMHLRESGRIPFKKQGNAFLYPAKDVKRSQISNQKASPK